MLRVGQISFANVAPFFHFWHDPSLEFIKGPPRYLGRLSLAGALDLAALPVMDGFALEDTFEPLGNFGIAATRQVMSVFLFSRVPISSLSGATIALTAESSTSVALLKLLLRERYRLTDIRFVGDPADNDGGEITGSCNGDPIRNSNGAAVSPSLGSSPSPSSSANAGGTAETVVAKLLIGDKALREARLPGVWAHTYDLAGLWNDWTSLPFTFARWVVRKSVAPTEKLRLVQALSQNLDRANAHLVEVATQESVRTGLDPEMLLDYLRNFIFRLGPLEEEGIALFKSKVKAMGLLEERHPGANGQFIPDFLGLRPPLR